MRNNERKKTFWSRVWYHTGFHGGEPYSTKIKKEDILPILVVLSAVGLVIAIIVYFA